MVEDAAADEAWSGEEAGEGSGEDGAGPAQPPPSESDAAGQ